MREGRHSTEGCRYTPLARVILSTAPLCLQNKPKRSILASQKAILLRSILSWHVKRATFDQKKNSNYAWIVKRAFQLLLKVHNFIFISAEIQHSGKTIKQQDLLHINLVFTFHSLILLSISLIHIWTCNVTVQ